MPARAGPILLQARASGNRVRVRVRHGGGLASTAVAVGLNQPAKSAWLPDQNASRARGRTIHSHVQIRLPPRPLSIAQPRPGLVCLSVSAVQGSEAFSNSDAAPQASRSLAAPMTMRPGLRSRPQQAQTHGGPKSGVAEQKRVPFVSSRPQAVPMAHLHPEQALLQPQLDSGQY
ncbi:hypothetical protein Purlil1_9938 [Purpureocillium lilacinum]|uniref:Uncharacterized protein n=1 Tax=Purpureocillium lilacinum TaxID=33203 RepID=A0ABR0BPZ7_PURLI|nr:hypothetical protein Purlil1_9938 [Purpureocillium lilacinum]